MKYKVKIEQAYDWYHEGAKHVGHTSMEFNFSNSADAFSFMQLAVANGDRTTVSMSFTNETEEGAANE